MYVGRNYSVAVRSVSGLGLLCFWVTLKLISDGKRFVIHIRTHIHFTHIWTQNLYFCITLVPSLQCFSCFILPDIRSCTVRVCLTKCSFKLVFFSNSIFAVHRKNLTQLCSCPFNTHPVLSWHV